MRSLASTSNKPFLHESIFGMDIGLSFAHSPGEEVDQLAVRVSHCTALAFVDPSTAEELRSLFPSATYIRSVRFLLIV